MDENADLVSAMLATAVCAVMLVVGQQYLHKHPELGTTVQIQQHYDKQARAALLVMRRGN